MAGGQERRGVFRSGPGREKPLLQTNLWGKKKGREQTELCASISLQQVGGAHLYSPYSGG